jgi:hypothetical protein
VFQNRVLRNILGPDRKEVTGDWRNLHNRMPLFSKYHQVIKSGMTGLGHVVCMAKKRNTHHVLKEKSEVDYLEDLGVGWKIVLIFIFKK